MKKLIFISIALLSLTAFESSAQLLEDNQSRLKTKKVSRGFFLFRNKNKAKSATGANRKVISFVSPRSSQVSKRDVSYRNKGVSPRYSPGSPFRNQKPATAPRFSGGNPFGGTKYKVTPRYSGGNPFRGRSYRTVARNSAPNPFRGAKNTAAPRYSSGRPFKAKDYRVTPRYSSGKPFRAKDYRITPRYSQGNPFRGSKYKVSPRYSPGKPFTHRDFAVDVRYSKGNPFRGAKYKIAPRYSSGMPFTHRDFAVDVRYSAGNPFRGVNWKVKPRYSDSKNRFVVNNYLKRQLRYYNESSNFKGDWKLSKRGPGDQHPSSNYHFAMRFSNPSVRKMFRKWNVFWVRVNGNKEASKGVKASVRSPKFDKNEKDIWNN